MEFLTVKYLHCPAGTWVEKSRLWITKVSFSLMKGPLVTIVFSEKVWSTLWLNGVSCDTNKGFPTDTVNQGNWSLSIEWRLEVCCHHRRIQWLNGGVRWSKSFVLLLNQIPIILCLNVKSHWSPPWYKELYQVCWFNKLSNLSTMSENELTIDRPVKTSIKRIVVWLKHPFSIVFSCWKLKIHLRR